MRTTCTVCPRRCRLAPGQTGFCRARRNEGGTVVAGNYGRVTSLALDPIEKKPLARYRPGTLVVSLGSYGCNLRCPFCQNAEISQAGEKNIPWREISPEELVDLTLDARSRDTRVIGIAYTYNEPLVGWEYVRDCARLAHEHGLANVLVSNGCVEASVLEDLTGLIDAANIDLKGFTDAFYDACGGAPGSLACVKSTIERLAEDSACHLEVTTLIVPGMNDTDEEIDAAARWLAGLDGGRGRESITYHVTRFFPRWHLTDRGPTPVETVYRLAEVARRHLSHVFTGNC
ncbi:AmmeMemoRadiSam system radical SAM enzyme [Collinsella tanakaei]|uniref:AmmeMemoRadiSam system radical SAM enzyme n=1 Tax=Collinsella tanakaei TaxID=626935 RepID=UPI0025A32A0A|nr:AmmeMemoRadiSam system radical SAM enzyme [Collinsella tanakaei]MDM8246878.1 AmmeMemoRadiSam system radical SAM enzyme [Collinsella tanakaei]